MLVANAPCTTYSFRFLAQRGYFNGTHCHRLTVRVIYVLQCGDPTGTGSGAPGYRFNDENLAGETYPAGTVAMATAPCSNSAVNRRISAPAAATSRTAATQAAGVPAPAAASMSGTRRP